MSILIRAQRPTEVPHRSVSHAIRIICLLILAAKFSSTTTWAVALKGTFTSELYARTTIDSEHFRPYASLRIQMPLYAGNRGRVSFKTYLRWATNVLDAGPDDPQLFVYDAYFRYQAPRRIGEPSLGRQFVYSGVGSDLLDGVRLRLGPYRKAALAVICLLGGCSNERTTSTLPGTHPVSWMDKSSSDYHGRASPDTADGTTPPGRRPTVCTMSLPTPRSPSAPTPSTSPRRGLHRP